jgi:hypothetical protein
MESYKKKSTRISRCLNDAIWINKYLCREPKIRIHTSVIRPILTYTVEIRVDITKQENIRKQPVDEIGIDHVRSWDIRHQYGIQEIGEWLNTLRSERNRHIAQMAIAKGRITSGRPHKRW